MKPVRHVGPLPEQALRWPGAEQKLLEELLEDAASELQEELLVRAVSAGHTAAEVHAFADAIRGFSDDEAFAACTLERAGPQALTVAQLLRAEADPLLAFEIQGGVLEPKEEAAQKLEFQRKSIAPSVEGLSPSMLPAALALKRRSVFDESSEPQVGVEPRRRAASDPMVSPLSEKVSDGASLILEDLINAATAGLGVNWVEHWVDVSGELTLEEGLAAAFDALGCGLPVPCFIGPAAGQHRRLVVMLQSNVTGRQRAVQLYDVVSHQVVWAHEGDLLGRAELPFSDKFNRRLTCIALPE